MKKYNKPYQEGQFHLPSMIPNHSCFYRIIRIWGPFSGSTSEILRQFRGVRAPAGLSGVHGSEPQGVAGYDWIGIAAPQEY